MPRMFSLYYCQNYRYILVQYYSKRTSTVCLTDLVMVKRKTSSKRSRGSGSPPLSCSNHSFSAKEVASLRRDLIAWYDENKRDLPWRNQDHKKLQDKAYGVWVSEIMLQQTQVATVIDYYNKWMKKWPTVADLAKSTLEEVNEMWSGLGYYSRGKRLREGAIKIIEELDGEMPSSPEQLIEKIPGVGRYTAGAVASIAFGQVTGLVDGNVMRVFSRMRGIGADVNSPPVTEALWTIANTVVDENRPGDFNQSLMELGATVCTPKTPACSQCPVKDICNAYSKVEKEKEDAASRLVKNSKKENEEKCLDIEDAVEDCKLCFAEDESWDSSLGVLNYPRKGKKKAPREERTCVCIIQPAAQDTEETEYLLVQRPETGLLAGLWEFPSVQVDLPSTEKESWSAMENHLENNFNLKGSLVQSRKYINEVVHIFSHIHQTYVVMLCKIDEKLSLSLEQSSQTAKWVTKTELLESAISTAMKKVFKSLETNSKDQSTKVKGLSKKVPSKSDGKKQLGMDAFFKPVAKKVKS